MTKFYQTNYRPFQRVISAFVAVMFVFSLIINPAQAQSVLNLPVPGTALAPTPAFTPVIMEGILIHPDDPLKFDFIMDKGDSGLEGDLFKEEANKLIKYFLAALTVPQKEMWVNLSPYEENRIIPQTFGRTEMGRDLLAQDYMLKQLSASMMNPDDDLGAEFWQRVYSQAQEKYGTTDIPMNTFNKIWIVPETATVYEHPKGAVIVKNHLKVMLEEDYLALEANRNSSAHGLGDAKKEDLGVISGVTAEVVREVLIPEIEREVNEGKIFANLRQIYNSMLLAKWYKENLQQSLLGKVYVDQGKTDGVNVSDENINQKIYNQYLQAFKQGVYNYIKEEYDPVTQQLIPRKYFSGGAAFNDMAMTAEASIDNSALFELFERLRPVVVRASMAREGRTVSTRRDLLAGLETEENGVSFLKGQGFRFAKEITDIQMVMDEAAQKLSGRKVLNKKGTFMDMEDLRNAIKFTPARTPIRFFLLGGYFGDRFEVFGSLQDALIVVVPDPRRSDGAMTATGAIRDIFGREGVSSQEVVSNKISRADIMPLRRQAEALDARIQTAIAGIQNLYDIGVNVSQAGAVQDSTEKMNLARLQSSVRDDIKRLELNPDLDIVARIGSRLDSIEQQLDAAMTADEKAVVEAVKRLMTDANGDWLAALRELSRKQGVAVTISSSLTADQVIDLRNGVDNIQLTPAIEKTKNGNELLKGLQVSVETDLPYLQRQSLGEEINKLIGKHFIIPDVAGVIKQLFKGAQTEAHRKNILGEWNLEMIDATTQDQEQRSQVYNLKGELQEKGKAFSNLQKITAVSVIKGTPMNIAGLFEKVLIAPDAAMAAQIEDSIDAAMTAAQSVPVAQDVVILRGYQDPADSSKNIESTTIERKALIDILTRMERLMDVAGGEGEAILFELRNKARDSNYQFGQDRSKNVAIRSRDILQMREINLLQADGAVSDDVKKVMGTFEGEFLSDFNMRNYGKDLIVSADQAPVRGQDDRRKTNPSVEDSIKGLQQRADQAMILDAPPDKFSAWNKIGPQGLLSGAKDEGKEITLTFYPIKNGRISEEQSEIKGTILSFNTFIYDSEKDRFDNETGYIDLTLRVTARKKPGEKQMSEVPASTESFRLAVTKKVHQNPAAFGANAAFPEVKRDSIGSQDILRIKKPAKNSADSALLAAAPTTNIPTAQIVEVVMRSENKVPLTIQNVVDWIHDNNSQRGIQTDPRLEEMIPFVLDALVKSGELKELEQNARTGERQWQYGFNSLDWLKAVAVKMPLRGDLNPQSNPNVYAVMIAYQIANLDAEFTIDDLAQSLSYSDEIINEGMARLEKVGLLQKISDRKGGTWRKIEDQAMVTERGNSGLIGTPILTPEGQLNNQFPIFASQNPSMQDPMAPLGDKLREVLGRVAGRWQMKGSARKGGIDLNPDIVQMNVENGGQKFEMPMPQNIDQYMNANGFVPVIINVAPVPAAQLPLLLGLTTDTAQDPAVSLHAS